jgi:hypothetical protein
MATNNATNMSLPVTVAEGGTSLATLTAHAIMLGEGTAAPSFALLGAGQLLIGTTAGDPVAATLTAGTGVTLTNASGAITIATSSGGGNVVNQTTGAATLTAGDVYINNAGASLITYTLPLVPVIGDFYTIVGNSSGGWMIAQNAGQSINVGNLASTAGVGGSVASTNAFDCITLRATSASMYTAYAIQGNLTVV